MQAGDRSTIADLVAIGQCASHLLFEHCCKNLENHPTLHPVPQPSKERASLIIIIINQISGSPNKTTNEVSGGRAHVREVSCGQHKGVSGYPKRQDNCTPASQPIKPNHTPSVSFSDPQTESDTIIMFADNRWAVLVVLVVPHYIDIYMTIVTHLDSTGWSLVNHSY